MLRVEDFAQAKPFTAATGKYVLFIASERHDVQCTLHHARAWLDAGASYICAWGPAAEAVEEAFDYAAFHLELGAPLPFTPMTTSHHPEPLEQALWFAFYSATPPDDLPHPFKTVIVVVDSTALEQRCVSWIHFNKE